MVVAGFALGSAATAHAQTDDERFVNAVDTLGIETAATPEELSGTTSVTCSPPGWWAIPTRCPPSVGW